MLPALAQIYRQTLLGMREPVSLWTLTTPDAGRDLRELSEQLAALSANLQVRHETCAVGDLGDPALPVLSPSGPQAGGPRGARFLGLPQGFLLDLLVDEVVALSRGQALTSPLARESLVHIAAPVRARVLATPG